MNDDLLSKPGSTAFPCVLPNPLQFVTIRYNPDLQNHVETFVDLWQNL